MPTQPQQPTSTGSLDPQAVALAQSIRQVESNNNPTATGKSGEYGAYQWEPATWAKMSAAAGVNVPLQQATPEQQNQVAYTQIKQWKDEGYNVGQIASMWNAGPGDPNAYINGNSGTNAEGVSYDTKAYAQKVAETYQQIKTQGSSQGYAAPAIPGTQPQTTNATNVSYAPPTPPTPSTSTTQPTPQGGGFMGELGNLAQNLVSGPVDLGTYLGQGLARATATTAGALGDTGLANDINQKLSQPTTTITGSTAPAYSTGPLAAEEQAGNLAQTAGFLVPGEGILGGAGMGALLGAGSAMSQGSDLPTVASSGALGGALGGAATGAVGLLGSGISKIGDLISGDTATKAVQGIKDAYSSALNLNAGERALENRSGKDLAQVLTDNMAPLSRNADGTLDASKAIPILQSKLAPLDTEANSILAGSSERVNLTNAANQAKQSIATKATTALERQSANADIDAYMQAEIQERTQKISQDTYGTSFEGLSKQQQAKVAYDAANPTVQEADKIKQGYWGSTFDKNRTNLQNHIPYQLGSSMKDAIENAVPDSKIDEVNSERGDLIDSIRRLQKMDGVKLLKGGKLGTMATGVIGSLMGAASGLGPLGVLGGDYFGSKAGELLQDPAINIGMATAKKEAASSISKLLGQAAKPIGDPISKIGQAVKSGARIGGLMANLLSK